MIHDEPTELAEGTMVTPSVRLVRPLASGAMGSVWVAYHLGLDTEVAVKFISGELLYKSPSLVARFKREASMAAKIGSPHVVRIFDHGLMADGTPYIVMELLHGESLADRLERRGALGLPEAERLLSQVARGLRKAHELGIVHRDIKPENLFLVDSGTQDDDEAGGEELFVKILDFGIAKQSRLSGDASLTAAGSVLGTPLFMSPEQVLSARAIDFRADLWALGVVMYFALTGEVPFNGETLGAIFQAITGGHFTLPSELPAALPRELDGWFCRALNADIEQRFGSAREMAAAFREALGGAAGAAGADRASAAGPGDEPAPGGGRSPAKTEELPCPAGSPGTLAGAAAEYAADALEPAGLPRRRRAPLAVLGLVGVAAVGLVAGYLALSRPPRAGREGAGPAAVAPAPCVAAVGAVPVPPPASVAAGAATSASAAAGAAASASATARPSTARAIAPPRAGAGAKPPDRPVDRDNPYGRPVDRDNPYAK
ncbi:MAG: serine/threonine protein kinase [Deltaproteobacteria bacterium]|nr:serine/threonine protein kinase [Deltaproteobacteria bacterium]